MTFCSYCGKKNKRDINFCSYCGKEINKSQKAKQFNFNPLKVSIFVGVIFIVSLSFVIVYLNQKNVSERTNDVQLALSEDRLIDINQQIKEIKRVEEKRKEGYLNEKPFDEWNYEYDERTRDFRLVCSRPCPVSKTVLDQEFAAISYAVSTLRGLTQSDIDEKLMPFEVHASEDIVCPDEGAPAYMSSFVDLNGYIRGQLCFKFDKVPYDRSNFPYSTSVHEVNHLFQDGKFPPYSGGGQILTEGLSMILDSFFEKGNQKDSFCWKGNNWYSKISTQSSSVHVKGAGLFYDLCNQYGFDYKHIPTLFNELEKRGGSATERDFVNIINGIVGADTSKLFRKAGVI